MNNQVVRIVRVQRVSSGDFQLNCGDELVCFFKVSNRDCIVQRATDSAVAEIVAERLASARFPGDKIIIKYEGV